MTGRVVPPRGQTRPRQPARTRPDRRRRLAAVVVLVALLALLLSMVVATAANAAPGVTVTEVGWWSRNPLASPPANGFTVATAPDGPASVSAVRLAVDGIVDQATLILNEAGGVPEAAALRVCVTPVSSWSASTHAWASAPTSDCARAVKMERNATTGAWTADVTALLQTEQTSVSLLVTPAPGPAPVWQVDFSAAIVAAQAHARPATGTSTEPGGSGSGRGGGSGSGAIVSGAGGSADAPSSTGGGGSFGGAGFRPGSGNAFDLGGAPTGFEPAAPVGSEPSLDPGGDLADVGGDSLATAGQVEGFVPASNQGPQPWGRLVVFVPLSILAGIAVVLGRERLLPRLLH